MLIFKPVYIRRKLYSLITFGLISSYSIFAQNNKLQEITSQVHGNFQLDAQYYNEDTLIKAPKVREKILSNGFGNINFTHGNFSTGLRYESYQNVMQGFSKEYEGQGITYRYARYKHKDLDFTLGNFYDQFGSGMIFRSYEARGLLFDNVMDGIRLIYNPHKAITLKGIIGKQRNFFTLSPGIIRGFDGEINVNDLFDSLNSKTTVIIGGSIISKHQPEEDALIIPENVGCYGGRLNIIRGGLNFFTEYAHKDNDPNINNNMSYKIGQSLLTSIAYSTNGFSLLASGKYTDNMNFRSDREATLTSSMINYLPVLSKNHTYLMMAFYPYATQPNGEITYAGELQYKFKKGSFFGGKYGTEVSLNYSAAYGIDTTNLDPATDSVKHVYKVNSYGLGEKYFEDLNIEINKKLSKKLKMTLIGSMQFYNKNVVQFGTATSYADIHSIIGVFDLTYKYKSGSSIRFETQTLQTKQDDGAWVSELIEWTPTTNWFVAVMDLYNYGNPKSSKQLHYLYGTVGYVHDETRITLAYGKQRAGIFCVGGVCRVVPASNGLSLTVSSSF